MHKCTVRHIEKYRVITSTYLNLPGGNRQLSTQGVVYNTDKEKGIKCYIDTNFSGGRAQADANNAENSMSHTGYVIMHTGRPVLLCSELYIKINLSTTEAEYIELGQTMHDVIPFMDMMKEV